MSDCSTWIHCKHRLGITEAQAQFEEGSKETGSSLKFGQNKKVCLFVYFLIFLS